jgi:hypothetical protein
VVSDHIASLSSPRGGATQSGKETTDIPDAGLRSGNGVVPRDEEPV